MPFEKGQSGNPGGRPKENAEVKALARSHGKTALQKIVALMDSEDERIALAASQTLLDRGFGKPSQSIVGGDEDDNPIRIDKIERVLVHAPNAED